MSSENERSIISQMWQMRQTITDLRREVDEQHKVKQSRGDKSWQIITIVLAATVSVAIGLVPKLLEERTPPDPWQSSSTNLNT